MIVVFETVEETAESAAARRAGLAEARERLGAARNVLVVTGAGISAESGVPTFRGPEGMWRQLRPEDLATPEAFARDPALVWEWYAWRRQRIAAVTPNAGHHALVRLEERVPEYLLATQNVDGLHALAGSRRMVELHGSIWQVRCVSCGAERDERGGLGALPPRCACGALLRPGVVWFGESLPEPAIARAFAATAEAEVVLVVGTSSIVYPAAGLPAAARASGAFLIEVNPEPTPLSNGCQLCLRGPAAELLPELVGEPR